MTAQLAGELQQILLVSICLLLLSQQTELNDKGPESRLNLLSLSMSVIECSSGYDAIYILLSAMSSDHVFFSFFELQLRRILMPFYFCLFTLFPGSTEGLKKTAMSWSIWHYVAMQRWKSKLDNLDPLSSAWPMHILWRDISRSYLSVGIEYYLFMQAATHDFSLFWVHLHINGCNRMGRLCFKIATHIVN